MPPVPQPNNVQAEDIGHSENPAHGDEQEIAGVHEVPGVQEENEAMAIDQVSMEAFHGSVNSDSPQASSITQATSSRMSPKKAVRVAAQRVRSIRKAVRSSFVDESESEPLNDVVAGPSGSGPAQAANSGGPILAAIAQQPPRPGLIQGPLNATPSPRGLGDRRRQRRRKFRLRASLAPHTAAPAPAGAVPPADGSPLARVSSQTVILGMLASQSHTQPANTPYFFKMAYPKEVDLSLPCAYCYLTMYHEPEDSPYRGGNGSVAGVGNAFSGNAQAIARSANTIKAAAMLAIRFFFKNLTPGSNFLTKIGYSSGDSGIGQTVLSQPETVLLAAYWDSWRQVNGKAFGQWWAEQEPRTEPAVEAAAEGWDLANLVW
ncbi:Checkpoint protein hus1 [Sporothrix bragantina]|uniref:Checkpoint protein hus1 n=1 Tax=Sporothrix bragantina TaxID=671064 RepID=A0ABP0B9W1_9PEZI